LPFTLDTCFIGPVHYVVYFLEHLEYLAMCLIDDVVQLFLVTKVNRALQMSLQEKVQSFKVRDAIEKFPDGCCCKCLSERR
jgi:hypothetical protein